MQNASSASQPTEAKPAASGDEKVNPDIAVQQKDSSVESSVVLNNKAPETSRIGSQSLSEAGAAAVVDTEERQAKAKQLIISCIEYYQQIQSYEDAAVFKLKVPYPTNPVDEQIPCRVALERPNRLAFAMGLLKSSWTAETFESIYADGSSELYPQQRLVRPLPEILTSDWLLGDHLENQLINPIFGLPLNVGFLLDATSSKAFINEVKTQWLSPAQIDGVKCERIQLTLKDVSWVYWIDEPNRLLLRQEFPHAVLTSVLPPIPSSISASEIVCQIDYANIKVNERVDWAPWVIRTRDTDVSLRRFVPTPVRDVALQLGRTIEPFLLKDVEGKVIFDLAERQSKVTSFHFVDDTEASRSYIDELYDVRRQLKNRGVDSEYETILISNRPAERMATVMASWNCTLPLAIDADGAIREQWGVSEAPATIVIGADKRVQHFSQKRLPIGMVSDIPMLVRGVDLATQTISTAVDNEARYGALLHRFVLSREELKKLPKDYQEIAPFPFFFHNMELDWRVPFDDGIVAAAGESFSSGLEKLVVNPAELYEVGYPSTRVMTVLDDVGNLWSIDQRGNRSVIATLAVEKTENAKRFWVYPDPWKHEKIYIVPEGLSRFWFAVAPKTLTPDWKPLPVDDFPLPAGETIINAAWVLADQEPAFCFITNYSRVIALNPATQAMSISLDGSKQKASVSSMIPKLDDKSLPKAWGVVRADGSIEYVEAEVSKSQLGVPPSLMFKPEVGPWLWGASTVGPRLVGLARIPSGETAAVVLDDSYKSLSTQSLATRPEQCRLLGSSTNKNGAFYFLITAPNRVLHLQTIGGQLPDQMSFGRRIFGGAVYPLDNGLRIVVAMEGEISSWTVTLKE